MKYPHLFEPGMIGAMEVKNRIVMAPMGDGLVGFMGTWSDRAVDYYERRAMGGTGLVITSLCLVDATIEPWKIQGEPALVTFDSSMKIRNFVKLTERVHDHGARIFAQLTAGFGRVYPPVLIKLIGGQPIAPSSTPLFWDPSIEARALTAGEIDGLIEAFGNAAVIARESGFDGIEIHGHEGYLIDQFTSALWNRREDAYGGDLEGRMRFPLEVIRRIQEAVGTDFPISYRYAVDHKLPGGRTADESRVMARILEAAGVAALHVDAGCYDTWHWAHPPLYQEPGCMVDMAEAVKPEVGIPVITVGRLGYPDLAERVLAEGKADFVALGRPLVADPDFADKARRGRATDIRPCIGCHECLARILRMQSTSCAVNPECGDEVRLSVSPATQCKTVMVVGGGIAGLEAARVCALRGHRVHLFERNELLGGILRFGGTPAFKQDLRLFLDHKIREVKRLENIDIHMWTTVDSETVRRHRPDVLFLATGSRFRTPEEAGIACDPGAVFLTAEEVYRADPPATDRVVIVGGGSVGCEVGLWLAQKGNGVTIVEQASAAAVDLFEANRQMLLELLADAGVRLLLNTNVLRIASDGVTVEGPDGRTVIPAERVVSALGGVPVDDLLPLVRDAAETVHVIGDCRSPRKIKDAIWEAFKLARVT